MTAKPPLSLRATTKNGRDIWTKLFYEFGASLTYTVADTASYDWAAKFDNDCRLPLYGVTFDFNKATIKPASEVVLARAASVLKEKSGFAVEVQGHTDNVGSDAARLSAKGYGKTQPVADNKSDFGRVKNRRVELVKSPCRK